MAQTNVDLRVDPVAPAKAPMTRKHVDHRLPRLVPPDPWNVSSPRSDIETTRVSQSPATQPYNPDLVEEEVSPRQTFSSTHPAQSDATEQGRYPRYVSSNKSVSFDDVFQGGEAPVKHIIAQPPKGDKRWFILRCNEHNHNFKHPPFRGAKAHLESRLHGCLSKVSNELIIECFGIEVLNCNDELAKKNNSASSGANQHNAKRLITDIADEIAPQRTSEPKRPRLTTTGRSRTVAADLLDIQTRSIGVNFPKAIQDFESTPPQLPLIRTLADQWDSEVVVPRDNDPDPSSSSHSAVHIWAFQKPSYHITNSETFRALQRKPPATASGLMDRPQIAAIGISFKSLGHGSGKQVAVSGSWSTAGPLPTTRKAIYKWYPTKHG
ncbi:hypothetical protein FDECE_17288 [Fusarium decemcellulare]|nr:hypothetical protein FDECE_17288 [Fusarium decemcellulare]